MKNKEKAITEFPSEEKISRKRAIKRAGFYAATAVGMVTLLGSPGKSAAARLPSAPPVW
jgi:hypothetical protein